MARDEWKCHLCGEEISRVEVHPHPLSATVDHVVPLAVGGKHSYENVRAAHFHCNNKKGAKHGKCNHHGKEKN
jgi:5-methylcytosine-specific restriction endonuclease McrA